MKNQTKTKPNIYTYSDQKQSEEGSVYLGSQFEMEEVMTSGGQGHMSLW